MTYSTTMDRQYIDGIIRADHMALKSLYKEFYPGIENYVRNNSGSVEDAQDLFQDALIVLCNNVRKDGFKLSASLFTYFYSICKNIWYKRLAQRVLRKKNVVPEGQEFIQDPFERQQEIIQYRLYKQKFAELKKDKQKVLELFLAGKSMKEIAQAMGYKSVQYAKKKKFECKERLKELIARDRAYRMVGAK